MQIGAGPDVEKAEASKAVRRGKGKMRNRRYVSRRGPLIIYAGTADESEGFVRALRNIPGVDTCHVERLNLLQARAYFPQMCCVVCMCNLRQLVAQRSHVKALHEQAL